MVRNRKGERNVRHQSNSNRQKHPRHQRNQASKRRPQPAAEGQKPGKPSHHLKKQRQQEKNPPKPPHIPIKETRRVASIPPDQIRRHTPCITGPGITQRQRRAGRAAVGVVVAADAEVGPLGDGAGALDAGGVGAEEVGLSEGRGVGYAREDDEPEEDEGAGEEEEGDGGEVEC
jgi:hypothetical protein